MSDIMPLFISINQLVRIAAPTAICQKLQLFIIIEKIERGETLNGETMSPIYSWSWCP